MIGNFFSTWRRRPEACNVKGYLTRIGFDSKNKKTRRLLRGLQSGRTKPAYRPSALLRKISIDSISEGKPEISGTQLQPQHRCHGPIPQTRQRDGIPNCCTRHCLASASGGHILPIPGTRSVSHWEELTAGRMAIAIQQRNGMDQKDTANLRAICKTISTTSRKKACICTFTTYGY